MLNSDLKWHILSMWQSFLFNEINLKQNGDEIYPPLIITYRPNDFNS